MRTLLLSLALLFAPAAANAADPPQKVAPVSRPVGEPPSELTDYVNTPDKSFSWKLADKTESELGTVYTLDLVSQTWHRVKWDHKIQVFLPKGVTPAATMPLWNEGGTPDISSTFLGLKLSSTLKCPMAIVFGIPKQPLYGGKTEDALIAESFVRYLVTEDPSWPLLFPMVKGVVRAMDAIQAFAKQEWKTEVKDFVVAGASKRGWTAWLTAATGDKRVKAIAPLVFDTLNLGPQMDHQVKCFGTHSDMIKDYSDRLLLPIPKTAASRKLWSIIDPWSYRERITCPKMMVMGTNDEYWTLDALNLYWDDLKGDKWVLYVPNAGHRLVEKDKNGKTQSIPERAFATLCAFCRAQVFGKPMPKIDAKYTPGDTGVQLAVGVEGTIKGQRLWSAHADSRDLRKSRWAAEELWNDDPNSRGRFEGTVKLSVNAPTAGCRACLVETEFDVDGLKFNLSTPLRILEPSGK